MQKRSASGKAGVQDRRVRSTGLIPFSALSFSTQYKESLMEIELKNLIEKIKKDGIDQADKDAKKIIEDARAEAGKMIEDAQKRGSGIVAEGERQVEQLKRSAEAAMRQAARDVLLSLREQMIGLFDRIINAQVSKDLDTELLKRLIIKAVENCSGDSIAQLEVLVNEQDKKMLEESLLAELGKKAKEQVVIKASAGVKKGFRIGYKESSSYFDFTDEAIAQMFMRRLNPRIVEILKIQEKGDS